METKQLKVLLERIPAAIAMFDRNMHYLLASNRWIEDFGLEAPSVGKNHYDIFPDVPDRWKAANQRGLSGEAIRAEEDRYDRSDGRVFWLRWEIVPWYAEDDTVGGILIFAEDLTEWKNLTEQLRNTDRRKDEFLAMLGHELRNPLVPVSYGVQLLQSDVDRQKQTQIIDMMSRQVGHLMRLVDDLLEISRINQGKIELRQSRIDLKKVVSESVSAKGPAIEAAGHRLSISIPAEPLPIWGDPTRISQVIGNLLNNAAKFTDSGGNINLSLTRDENDAVVSIRDNGAGIPEHMLSQIFDLFTQIEPCIARSEAGLGLGLALVRTLISMHGGSVEARSDGEGCGSEFIVRLPLADEVSYSETN